MLIVITSTMPWARGVRVPGTNDWHIDTKDLSDGEFDAVRQFAKENPDKVRFLDAPTQKTKPAPAKPESVDTRPDVVEHSQPYVPFVDPIDAILREDVKRQIDKQQAEERLLRYQVEQGLVDDKHNATLIRDWIVLNMRGYFSSLNIDHAVRALKSQLHVKQLSEFTKRLAGF